MDTGFSCFWEVITKNKIRHGLETTKLIDTLFVPIQGIFLSLHTHTIKHSLTKYPNSSLKKSNLTFLSKPISHQVDKEDILINDKNEWGC